MTNESRDNSVASAAEVMATVGEISDLLETGLDDQMLLIIVRLCELGVNPEALASIIQELQQEMAAYKSASGESTS
ncbi:mitotic-spindle organizing protein 1-like [Amphiura filiformis]|uniref:mitotic-spindle organizing protein 1-like n=1 Tax=Amphiura filiformis TaxID=82378 RepID=UPI003B220905